MSSTEKSVGSQSPIAGLEDVQRQQRVRKEHHLRQGEHRHQRGDVDRFIAHVTARLSESRRSQWGDAPAPKRLLHNDCSPAVGQRRGPRPFCLSRRVISLSARRADTPPSAPGFRRGT
jgi:hypothetical protein